MASSSSDTNGASNLLEGNEPGAAPPTASRFRPLGHIVGNVRALGWPQSSASSATSPGNRIAHLRSTVGKQRSGCKPEDLYATQERLRKKYASTSTFAKCLCAPAGTESIGYAPGSSGQYLEYLARLQGLDPSPEWKGWRGRIFKQGHFRWVLLACMGLVTGLIAVAVEQGMEHLFHFRMHLNDVVVDAGVGVGLQYLAFEGVCLGLASVAAFLVCFVEDLAAGSGIPEIKCYLNGVALPKVVGPKALLAKAVGIVFSVAAGLPCGKEGPMIHSGAIVGALMSETQWGKTKPFSLVETEQRDFVAAGAAAGVAAAFGAPFGGCLFAVEEGASYMNSVILLKLFVGAATATLVVKFFIAGFYTELAWGRLGARVPVSFGAFPGAESGQLDYEVSELPIFALIAAAGGLAGALFNATNKRITKWRTGHVGRRGCRRFVEALLVTLLITSIAFWAPVLLNGCVPKRLEELTEAERLFWQPGAESLKALFHHKDHDFDNAVLLAFTLFNYAMSCLTYGLGVPSGLFVPSLLTGAAFGRLVGQLLNTVAPASPSRPWASNSLYALVGATAGLSGAARITISLAMILLETSGAANFGLPLFITVMVAKWVGDIFTRGIYDMHIIELKHVPLLEVLPEKQMDFMQVRDVMAADPVMFQEVEVIGDLVAKLNACSHNGFPVCYSGTKAFSGIIRRSTLNALLLLGDDYDAFLPAGSDTGEVRQVPSAEGVIPFDSVPWGYLKNARFKDIYRFPPDDPLTTELRKVDLRPYINRNGYVIPEHAPLSSCYVLIRQVGIRHLPVLDRGGDVVGFVTRKDLILCNKRDDNGDSDDSEDTDATLATDDETSDDGQANVLRERSPQSIWHLSPGGGPM